MHSLRGLLIREPTNIIRTFKLSHVTYICIVVYVTYLAVGNEIKIMFCRREQAKLKQIIDIKYLFYFYDVNTFFTDIYR